MKKEAPFKFPNENCQSCGAEMRWLGTCPVCGWHREKCEHCGDCGYKLICHAYRGEPPDLAKEVQRLRAEVERLKNDASYPAITIGDRHEMGG